MINYKSMLNVFLLTGTVFGTYSCSNDDFLSLELSAEEPSKVISFEISTPTE